MLKIVEEALDACDVEFYDAYTSQSEIGQTLHVKIDSEKGVTADVCASTAQHLRYHLATFLDNVDKLNIEVGSPGVERALKKPAHFIKAINKEAKIKFTTDELTSTKTGLIISANEEAVVLKSNDTEYTLSYPTIHHANIVFSTHGSFK